MIGAFQRDVKVGEGAFGTVYDYKLPEGSTDNKLGIANKVDKVVIKFPNLLKTQGVKYDPAGEDGEKRILKATVESELEYINALELQILAAQRGGGKLFADAFKV